MLEETINRISALDVSKPICIDIESISFNDDEPAFRPYNGHRISTFFILQDGHDIIAPTLRSNAYGDKTPLLPLDKFVPWFQEWANKVKHLINHNLKFDLRFFAQDGIFFNNARLEDTMVLARLVNNDLMSYSLDSLCKLYKLKHKKDDLEISEYLQRIKSKDYGKIPIDMLVRYGSKDVEATLELWKTLTTKLPEESKGVWDTECALCRRLFELEHRGIYIDKRFLMKRSIILLTEMVELQKEILNDTKGVIDNPSSPAQIAEFMQRIGINPVMFTYDKKTKQVNRDKKTGEPKASWSSEALEQIVHPVARKLIKYSEKETQNSSFCTAWCNQTDINNRIHPDFRSAGARTGRISAAKPNVYNPPKWIMEAILIPDGYIGIKWDKKQIEYRLFAHYSKDESILAQYAANPEVDFHQILADKLGLPRDPTKNLNFGILYGMGKDKLKRRIAVNLSELENDLKENLDKKLITHDKYRAGIKKVRDAIRKYLAMAGSKVIIEDEAIIPTRVFDVVSEQILIEYHKTVPTVKLLQNQVRDIIKHRGYIRNYFNRCYYYPIDKAYVAFNALIQGSSADFFKQKIVALLDECDKVTPGVELIDMIYDSFFAIMPIQHGQMFWDISKRIVGDAPFRVPILLDGEVALGNFGNITKITNNDVLGSAGSICKIQSKSK